MEYLKKNYEKVLLAVVLLGLTAAVAALPIFIKAKQQSLDEIRNTKTNTPAKPLPQLNTAAYDAILQRVQSPIKLDFTTKHNLLNPVLWQTMPNGSLVKVETGKELGAGALEVANIKNLYLSISYEGVDPSGYIVKTTDQAPRRVVTRTTIVSQNTTNNYFALTKVGGAPDRPELELKFKETGETFTIAAEKPYNRVSGHLVDLRYPPDTSTPPMNDKRMNDSIRFGGADYVIIYIGDTSVEIMDKSTGKKTTVLFNRTK